MLEPFSTYVTNRGTTRTWFGGLGTILAASGLTAIGDGVGALAGVALVVCWYTVPAPYTVAVGFLLVAVVAPASAFSMWGIPIALGLGIVLVEPAVGRDEIRRMVLVTGATIAFLGGSGWAVARTTDDLWPVASSVVVFGGTSLYILHRYQRSRLQQAGVAA